MSDPPKNFMKLCILNAKESDDDDKIRSLCEQFGHLVYFNRPPSNKRLAFPLYSSESDAQRAKDGLIAEGYRVEYANAKRNENSSEDTVRQKRSEFRSPKNLPAKDDCSENGYEADSSTVQTDNRPYGVCIKCGDKAYYNCGRCREFYCSEECQESDWLVHKPNCISMPKLVPAKSTYSIRGAVSRSNLSDSSEKLKVGEDNHVTKSIDAADGQQNGELLPQKAEPMQQKAESIASVNKKIASAASDVVSISDKRSKAGTLMEENRAAEKVIRSPRARLLAQTNGEPTAQAPAQPTNGLVTESIPNNSEVFITHVRNHQSVYIRSANTNDEYAKLITEVEVAAKTQPKLTVYPKRQDIVMAPFEGMFYRAMVINSDKASGTVKVGFIDFGNSDEVQFGHMKSLPEELRTHRRLIIMVNLKNLNGEYEPNVASMLNHLGDLCNTGTGLKVKGDNAEISARDSVELYDLITNQPISEVLNAMAQKRYRLEDLKEKHVNASDEIIMVIGSERIAENYVTCILKTDVNQFMEGDIRAQEYGASVKNAPAYKPREKELCVVEIKEPEGKIWYRCQYQQELVDDRAQVYCFDYGKICNVRANNIRAMTGDLAFDIASFVGRLENGGNIEEVKKSLNENPEALAKSIKFDGDLHRITMA